jgi:hypothetical protein
MTGQEIRDLIKNLVIGLGIDEIIPDYKREYILSCNEVLFFSVNKAFTGDLVATSNKDFLGNNFMPKNLENFIVSKVFIAGIGFLEIQKTEEPLFTIKKLN